MSTLNPKNSGIETSQLLLSLSEQRDAQIMLKNNSKRKTNNRIQLLD